MIDLSPPFRPATPDDAPVLATLVNAAGEGLADYFWRQSAEPGETAWDVGIARARRETGSFSYKNAIVTDLGTGAVASLVGYRQPPEPAAIEADTAPIIVPLLELENLAPDTWYVNVLAVLDSHRGQGLGTGLLRLADTIAAAQSAPGMSIIVADTNVGARRLYESLGYREIASRPMVKQDWDGPGNAYVLLVKQL